MCKWCMKGNKINYFYVNHLKTCEISAAIIPNEKTLAFDFSNGQMGYTDSIEIKYCPFCGRKLDE